MEHIAHLVTGLCYAPAGLLYGYLLVLPIAANKSVACLYDETLYWPHIIIIIAMIITVLVTNGLKLNYGKTQFVHLYLNLAAVVIALAVGLIFLLAEDVVPAIYLGAVSVGLTLVPGLSYLHVRCRKRHRVTYMSLCTFWYLVGIASLATMSAMDQGNQDTLDEAYEHQLHQNLAISLLACSAALITCIALVEMLQREAFINYRKPLDYDTAMAHDSGELLKRHQRSHLTFSRFGHIAAPFGGISSEHMVGPSINHLGASRYRTLWTVYSIATKLIGLLAFYWVLLFLGFQASVDLFEQSNAWYVVFWIMVAGALFTTLATAVLSTKLLFLFTSIFYVISLVLSIAFYASDLLPLHFGIAKLVFYAFIGATLPLPAINILELAPLNYNETALAFGTTLELLAVALLQYYGSFDGKLFGMEEVGAIGIDVQLASNHTDIIIVHYVVAIVLGLGFAVIVLWHMPVTHRKSLPEIESDLGQMRSYFAFSRTMVPVHEPSTQANGAARNGDIDAGNNNLSNTAQPIPPASERRTLELDDEASQASNRFTDFGAKSHEPHEAQYDDGPGSRAFNDFDLDDGHMASAYGAKNFVDVPYSHGAAASDRTGPSLLYTGHQNQRALSSPPPPLNTAAEDLAEAVRAQPLFAVYDAQKREAPAPPPLPPAGYLTKSLPRVKAVRQSRIPPIVPKPKQQEAVVVPGVEYLPNLVPSHFLRQSLQNTQLFH
ncbi:uncharacterized protein LOC131213672 [Anopheles bellator]|uniref:uncharacterized protein LOC131213672 n=1 Tax=Anopheles bellator TaxID=139047 RepID=UPI0026481617|nr:uncharacterized protein LOC131213672 [Anopheles bellator]